MFQYTNTIVLNSLKDEESGLDKIKELKEGSTVTGIHILRVNPFLKSNVCALYKRTAQDPVNGKVAITLTGASADLYRIKLYARLSGNQNSYYSNDFVFKGKPFVYEFNGTTDATAVAKIINKINAIYGDKFLTISGTGSIITFTGDEFINFTEAKLQKYVEGTEAWKEGSWNDVSTTITKTPCVNGFGTYAQMLKDLRLPTMENRRWEGINKEELPIPGAKYDQFIIEYAVERGIMGGDVIGHVVKSKTSHVFFVNQNISSDFETQVKKLETSGSVTLTTVSKPISISVTSAATLTNAATAKTMTVKAADSVKIDTATGTSSEIWLTVATSVSNDTVTVTLTPTANSTTGSTARTADVTIAVVGKNGAQASITTSVTQPGA